MQAHVLWRDVVTRSVQLLDWRAAEFGDERFVQCRLARPAADAKVQMSALAGIEVDKLVAYASPSEALQAASAARSRMVDLLLHEPLEYDAVLSAKANYRGLLGDAVWRRVQADPPHKLEGLAAAQED